VRIGYPKDTLALADQTLRQILALGFTPMAMWRPETPSQEKAPKRTLARLPAPMGPPRHHPRQPIRAPKSLIITRKALDADRQNRRPPGRPKNADNGHRDVNVSRPTGNSAAAAFRRLERQRPDLLDRVLGGELSPHAAMIAAGFRKRRGFVR
jgi:hypothetical protein